MTLTKRQQRQIDYYQQQFQEYGTAHYWFACHAAFPVVFSVDMLHQLWTNFNVVDEVKIPKVVISDFLLSNLCQEVGLGLYEFRDKAIRAALLRDLEQQFDRPHRNRLAAFLYQYAQKHYNTPEYQNLKDTHQWTALATLNPQEAIQKIGDAISKLLVENDTAEKMRIHSLLEEMVEQQPILSEILEVIEKAIEDKEYISTLSKSTGDDFLMEIKIKIPKRIKQQNTALQLIAKEKIERTGKLDLGKCEIYELPKELFELTWLEELYVCNSYWSSVEQKKVESKNDRGLNNLSQIPNEIAKLTNLKVLRLNGYWEDKWHIKDISPLQQLTNLEILDLSDNDIEDITLLQKLTNLTYLDLSDNPNINDYKPLEYLTGLSILDLSYNGIKEIDFLKDLTLLSILNLRDNQILDLSPISSTTHINRIDVSKNPFTDLRVLLTLIKKGLSVEFKPIDKNSFILIEDCEVTVPPLEIIKQGNKAIINFLNNYKLKFIGNLPIDDLNSIKKEKELKEIYNLFSKDNNTVFLVNAFDGIGKTTIATKYFYKYLEYYNRLIWLSVQNSISESLLTLANDLDITFLETETKKERLETIFLYLRQLPSPILLVLDNLNDDTDLDIYLQKIQSTSKIHCLITTRFTNKFPKTVQYFISSLSDIEAIKFFNSIYPNHFDDGLLLKTFNSINKNTLIFELLAKSLLHINNRNSQIEYTLFELLERIHEIILQADSNEMTFTVRTFQYDLLTKEKPQTIISSLYEIVAFTEEEKSLLFVFAVLPSENISYEKLNQIVNFPKIIETLLALVKKGWLGKGKNNEAFKINPLIQDVIKLKTDNLHREIKYSIQKITNKLTQYVLDIAKVKYQDIVTFSRYGESIISSLSEIYDNDLGLLCEKIGIYNQITGNLEKTLKYFEKAYNIFHVLSSNEETNIEYKNHLAIAYSKLGETHTALGNLNKALELFEKDTQLTKELYKIYPNNVNFKNGLAISYEKLGDTYSALGYLKKALEFFEKEIILFRELYESYPTNVSFKNGLAISYEKLGSTYSDLGYLKKALDFFERRTQLAKELYESYPNNVNFKNGLAISYSKLGATYSDFGDLNKALDFFERRTQLAKELYENYPNNVNFKNGLAIAYSKLGDTHSDLGNLNKALDFFEKEITLFKELYESYPSNVSFKNGLAISYSKLGDTHSTLGNLNKALEFFRKYNDLEIELTQVHPDNINFKNGLAVSFSKLGFLHKQLRDYSKSNFYLSKAETLLIQLVDSFPNYIHFKKNLKYIQEEKKDGLIKIHQTHSGSGDNVRGDKY